MQPARRRSVVDVALQGDAVETYAVVARAKALNRLRIADILFRVLTRAAAIGVLVILGGVIISLIDGSLPALRAFGLNFLVEERWNPVTEKFGALAPIYGTLVTSFIAMLIAVPVGLLIAVFLTELCPMWLRRPIGIAIELLGHSKHHLWHLGPVRIRALPAGDLATVPDRDFRQYPRAVDAVCRAALWHRHADRGPHSRDHGAALRHLDLARRVRCRSARAQGSRLRHRLHHVGGRSLRRAALHAGRGHRRRDAGTRPGARRDHGGDLRDRQRAQSIALPPGTGHHHFGHHRQRIHRSGRRPLHLLADRAGPDPLRHHLHRARDRTLHAVAHRAPDRMTP